ncbi:DUF641 domain-containing protein [Cephalotus follicularis]|uniref:DUF641 domain-containing protein n=1 Tax=Cephalotus follicularis TaxID=3775 RepID=A0A1Q3C2N9_CEPFO|nr:DUF641 domain-containing protein [Cephalotus follicularis]
MANKISSFSDLIQRVTASCLLHPLADGRQDSGEIAGTLGGHEEEEEECKTEEEEEAEEGEAEEEGGGEGDREGGIGVLEKKGRTVEMEMLMTQVFEAVSAMKRAYVSLQEAHSPWDPERMRVADVAVIGELRRLGVLRERFKRSGSGGGGGGGAAVMLSQVVAPYEAALEELKREVKDREAEVESLKEKLRSVASLSNGGGGKKVKGQSRRKVSSSQALVATDPAPDLFESTMRQVKETSKSFTSLLLSLMRAAHWDIAAAVRSIEAASTTTPTATNTTTSDPTAADTTDTATCSIISTLHAKYALESYISHKIFQGFDHETFYMDGSLSSLLNPDQYRRNCFSQYRDMKAMDPAELLGILPTCSFGKFCSKKYLSIVHPKMEESLFGHLEQHNQVLAGNHPRSQFYGMFLGLAKAVWLLHLLAFSLDPPPSRFEASKGADFHPQYMESVAPLSDGWVPADQIVGFPVSPGFKLRNGSIIKARVYLVHRT